MGKIYYLFSRINKETGFTLEQEKYILKDVKNNSNITFVSALKNEPEHLKESIENKLNNFKNIKIAFNNIYIIDENTNKKEAKEYINKADIVFLLGGCPYIQMEIINKNEIKELIKQKELIIGVSAGAMNQAKRVVYRDEFENNRIYDYEGLDLVKINVYPHFDSKNQELLDEIDEVSKMVDLILIPDESLIRIENSKVEYIGTYYKAKKGIIEK